LVPVIVRVPLPLIGQLMRLAPEGPQAVWTSPLMVGIDAYEIDAETVTPPLVLTEKERELPGGWAVSAQVMVVGAVVGAEQTPFVTLVAGVTKLEPERVNNTPLSDGGQYNNDVADAVVQDEWLMDVNTGCAANETATVAAALAPPLQVTVTELMEAPGELDERVQVIDVALTMVAPEQSAAGATVTLP